MWRDACGALQSYAASAAAVACSIVNSNAWMTCVAILSALLVCIRLYKEIKSLFK